MYQGLDLEMVRQHYLGISDHELIRIINEDGISLTPEAKDIVRLEVQRRKLAPDLMPFLNAQLKDYSNAELEELCEVVRRLSCPVCGKADKPLNKSDMMQVVSFILITNVNRRPLIACPDCLDKAVRRSTIITALFGWWGLPWGIIRTIQALSNNFRNRKANHVHFPNNALKEFVIANAGAINIHQKDQKQLMRLIRSHNNQSIEAD